MITIFVVTPSVSADATDYPWMYLETTETGEVHYVGDTVRLVFTYFPEYEDEWAYVDIYDPDGNLVATADSSFENTSDMFFEYTVTWDTTDYVAGRYKIVTSTEFYSYYRWNQAPYNYTYYITLKPESERPADGWYLIGKKWAFYRGGNKVTNEWIADSQGWCYLGDDGYCVTDDWQSDSYGWCYLDSNGRMVKNKWIQVDGDWYFMSADGYAVTSAWRKDYKGWCYLGSDGKMATNRWVKDSQGWCYVGANGYCVTNAWKQDSYGWCYVGADGYCVTNTWKKDYKGWCYLDSNGRMATNRWVKDSQGWCYVGADGYVVANG